MTNAGVIGCDMTRPKLRVLKICFGGGHSSGSERSRPALRMRSSCCPATRRRRRHAQRSVTRWDRTQPTVSSAITRCRAMQNSTCTCSAKEACCKPAHGKSGKPMGAEAWCVLGRLRRRARRSRRRRTSSCASSCPRSGTSSCRWAANRSHVQHARLSCSTLQQLNAPCGCRALFDIVSVVHQEVSPRISFGIPGFRGAIQNIGSRPCIVHSVLQQRTPQSVPRQATMAQAFHRANVHVEHHQVNAELRQLPPPLSRHSGWAGQPPQQQPSVRPNGRLAAGAPPHPGSTASRPTQVVPPQTSTVTAGTCCLYMARAFPVFHFTGSAPVA